MTPSALAAESAAALSPGPGSAAQCNVYRCTDGSIWWGPWPEGAVLVGSTPLYESARAIARLLSEGDMDFLWGGSESEFSPKRTSAEP